MLPWSQIWRYGKVWLTLASIEAVVDDALFFLAIFDFLKGTQKEYWSFKGFV